MSNVALQQSAVSQLVAQANAVGGLAQDTGAFAAAVAAFESNDPNAFAWVLQRLEMIPQCELICEWIRVKLCVLRCVEVCGPSDPKVPVPELPQFARAITQLASNEAVLRRVVDAVSCGDANSFHAAIAEARLEAFCHLLCRYVCSTIYRRICEVVCTQQTIPVADAALEIRADAEVLARVFANEHLSAVISRAAVALDCEPLRSAIAQAGFTGSCEIICRLICVWRCVWVCHDLCIEPPPILAGAYAIDESRKFALAARPLAGQPRALADLVNAVVQRNANDYGAIVNRFGLGPYCWQVCAWVCSEVCFEFCICVCPPPQTQPLFTYIGHFDIYTDIDPSTGKTNKGLAFPGLFYNGGPNFAFNGQLQLAGYCPIYSPSFPGAQMKYRFLYSIGGGPQSPITANLVSMVQVGTPGDLLAVELRRHRSPANEDIARGGRGLGGASVQSRGAGHRGSLCRPHPLQPPTRRRWLGRGRHERRRHRLQHSDGLRHDPAACRDRGQSKPRRPRGDRCAGPGPAHG